MMNHTLDNKESTSHPKSLVDPPSVNHTGSKVLQGPSKAPTEGIGGYWTYDKVKEVPTRCLEDDWPWRFLEHW